MAGRKATEFETVLRLERLTGFCERLARMTEPKRLPANSWPVRPVQIVQLGVQPMQAGNQWPPPSEIVAQINPYPRAGVRA